MEPTLPLLLAVFATFFGAGVVKGVTGMGLPTVAMGVLGAFLSPLAAAGLLLAPSFVTNAWQLLVGPSPRAALARFWPMMLAIVAGTLAASAWLARGDTGATTTALGAALAVYASVAFVAPPFRMPMRWERSASPVVGLLTGLATGGTGVFVIPAVPYLQSLELPKDELVQALGLSFTVSTIALAIGLGWNGTLGGASTLGSLLAVIPALAGMAVGQRIRSHIDPPLFRRVFLVFLLLLGVEMASRPFIG